MRLSIYDGFGGSKVERTGNGVVQRMKLNLNDVVEEDSNKVYMWWPRRGSRGKQWEGELVLKNHHPKGK